MADSKSSTKAPRISVISANTLEADNDLLRRAVLQRTESEELIDHNGRYGLFTPLTSDKEEAGEATEDNLHAIIEIMRQDIGRLQQKNLQLEDQLRQVVIKPPRTPDDVMTAITHSVDSLQAKLAKMTNPVSDFVLREFTIETKAYVDITPLGMIEYRFIQPGDAIDPACLSQLRMTLAPVPKKEAAGSWSGPGFTPFEDIEEIQGIGEVNKKRLNSHNIYTVSDLLHAGTRVRSRVELAALLEVDHKRLSQWMSHAELLTVKEIDARAAELLFEIGISSLAGLAAAEATGLVEFYNQRVQEKGQAVLKPIDAAMVQRWIDTAKAFVGARPKEEKQ
ncbi:MAG: DUF4332 domain-containing protein [Desulfobacterales bacterium]|nr:DUF4332 domain-containing protein [Desulfobacterales bacterium]